MNYLGANMGMSTLDSDISTEENMLKYTIHETRDILGQCIEQDDNRNIVCKDALIKVKGKSNDNNVEFNVELHNKNSLDISLTKDSQIVHEGHFNLSDGTVQIEDIYNSLLKMENYAENFNFIPLRTEISMCNIIEGSAYHTSITQQIFDGLEHGKEICPTAETTDHTLVV